jgi:hypothetical protein
LQGFADQIAACEQNQAVALGSLRSDLVDHVKILTKSQLNASTPPEVIARTSEFISYQAGKPALLLIDVDVKGMPSTVKDRIRDLGGIWPALISVLPEIATAAHVRRRSTTTGLSRSDTGARLAGSNGLRAYILVEDGVDIERTLHQRCWLAGLGWMMIGRAGQFLSRSLVDRSVYAPERLVFEAAPVVDPPLLQDQASRAPSGDRGAGAGHSGGVPRPHYHRASEAA